MDTQIIIRLSFSLKKCTWKIGILEQYLSFHFLDRSVYAAKNTPLTGSFHVSKTLNIFSLFNFA